MWPDIGIYTYYCKDNLTLALSYQYGHKNSVAYFHFEQLSIISVVSLLLTFNKYTASAVLTFSIHNFYHSKYSQ